ncbi:hypothetical protein ACHQM5_027898 [Ranunculus cassubicifolius]
MLPLLIQLFITVIILDGVHVTSQSFGEFLECIFPNSSSCSSTGDVIRYPFWMKDEAAKNGYFCGYQGLSISCRDEYGGRPVINISNHLYHVLNFNNEYKRLRIVDVDIDGSECPRPRHNLSFDSTTPFQDPYRGTIICYNCSKYPEDATIHHLPCLDHVNGNVTLRSFLLQSSFVNWNWNGNCKEAVKIPYDYYSGISNYTQMLKLGFDLYWYRKYDSWQCEDSGGESLFNETTSAYHCLCWDDNAYSLHESVCPDKGVCTAVGASLFILILVLCYKRNLFSTYFLARNQSNVEVFLENCGSLATQRYKYSDIKKMTDSFKEKLGQGGFGSVFKGRLNDGQLVAVKVLNDSKSNGEDFINEVAAISRTNHVNVVDLLGFCSEGTKRALVYEFMPNGSLEKFIYNAKTSNTPSLLLGWEKLHQIALGIAKGLEYLHRGCNTRILHFDIKPHNILLDEDFCPKIADFGLARLCPTKESVVSMLVARGTIGYIAPEVYCRNFGGVSHKSDVYSYGMMVLEMIGGRKNIDVSVENTSEIYFPQWIYNHFKLDVSVDGRGEIFEDKKARKMITVALWCIQTQPAARPSITRVVEMLEGDIEGLEMPPNPFQDPASSSSP